MSFLNGTEKRRVNGVLVESTITDDYTVYHFPGTEMTRKMGTQLMQWEASNGERVITGTVFSPEEFDVVHQAFPNLGFSWQWVGGRVNFDSRVGVGDADDVRAKLEASMSAES
jgi:hypothetical protein